jgi:hypothetical protein
MLTEREKLMIEEELINAFDNLSSLFEKGFKPTAFKTKRKIPNKADVEWIRKRAQLEIDIYFTDMKPEEYNKKAKRMLAQ